MLGLYFCWVDTSDYVVGCQPKQIVLWLETLQ